MDRKGFAVAGAKRSAGVTPEVNLRNPLHGGDKASEGEIHPSFEPQSRCHKNSKTKVSAASGKELTSSKI